MEGRGSVEGAGIHSQGERVTLTAVPDDGYDFDYWSGDIKEDTQQNPIKVTADVAKRLTAKFSPLTPDLITAESTVAGVNLTWRNLAWAQEYRVYRAPSSEFPPMPIATLTAGNSYLDESGEQEKTCWYWVEAVGPGVAAEDEPIVTRSADPKTAKKVKPVIFSPITYTNLRGATHSNPPTYQEETSVSFTAPSAVTGYTFTGWDPSIISSDMTGAIDVRATWSANTYTIVYHAGEASGTTEATDCTYDRQCRIAENGFVREGHIFLGWATEAGGEVVYSAGENVMNLSAEQNGIVELWAVWELDRVEVPLVTSSEGTVFKTETTTVAITCATPDADIYYTTNGRTPRRIDANLYNGPFTISDTTTILAFAVKDEKESELVEITFTHVVPVPLTLKVALGEAKLGEVVTGGDAEWTPVEDDTREAGGTAAKSGIIGDEQMTYLETTVKGKGTLTFWWKTNCEKDSRNRFSYDHATFIADGVVKFQLDGASGWVRQTCVFTEDGLHTIRWMYETDDYEESVGEVRVSGVTWSGENATAEMIVVDDPNGKIVIPPGTDPATLDIKIMSNGHDIRSYLDLPAAQNGEIDLSQATVKEEIVKEALTGEGSEVTLDAANPTITTAKTIPGLTYTFREGTSIEALSGKTPLTHLGDGKSWTPPVTVKGGNAAFYSIGVTK